MPSSLEEPNVTQFVRSERKERKCCETTLVNAAGGGGGDGDGGDGDGDEDEDEDAHEDDDEL